MPIKISRNKVKRYLAGVIVILNWILHYMDTMTVHDDKTLKRNLN